MRAAFGGEHHADRDDEEHDAAAEVEGAAADAQPAQEAFAEEEDEQEQQEDEGELSQEDVSALLGRELLQEALYQGGVTRWVQHKKECTGCGYDVVPVQHGSYE